MGRIFETEACDDDETSIRLYFGYEKKELNSLISHLENLRDGETDDDYIILQSTEQNRDLTNRMEVIVKFVRD